MFAIIGILLAGLLVGWLLRAHSLKPVGKVITVLVFLLLFALGLEVGSSEEVVQNLPELGGAALAIAIFAILGSVLLAWLLYRWGRKKGQEES
ncbi:MAG: LysO family transporter [Porphyromonas sp.]|nr:LysO family transporter [Porphyromonas sp.]